MNNYFGKSSKVLTERGYLTIIDIKIGDKIISSDGFIKKIITKKNIDYNENVYIYSSTNLIGDLTVTSNIDKLFLLNKINDLSNNADLVIDLYELLKGHNNFNGKRKLLVEKDIIFTSFLCIGGNGAQMNKVSPSLNRFIKIDKSMAYSLGRFVGDGSTFLVNKQQKGTACDGFNIVFSKKEINELIWIKSTLSNSFNINLNVNYSKNQDCVYIRKNNIIVSTFFREICGHGFALKKVPYFIWSAPLNIREHFLLGVFDSDGCVTSRLDAKIVMQNDSLINDLQALFLSIGIPTVKRIDSTYKCPGLFISKMLGETFIKKSLKQYSDNRINAERVYPKDMMSRLSVKFESNNLGSTVLIKDFKKELISYKGPIYNIEIEDNSS